MSDQDGYECERCGCTDPEEVTGGWRCSRCEYVPPECTCYEHIGGHQPGCGFGAWLNEAKAAEKAKAEQATDCAAQEEAERRVHAEAARFEADVRAHMERVAKLKAKEEANG